MRKNSIIIMAILLLATSAMAFTTGEEISEDIIYEKVSLRNLEVQLDQNAARAKKQYQGMYVEFEAKIRNIDSDGEYFSIGDNFIATFFCYTTNEEQKQVLLDKNRGSIVHVKGKITKVGEILGYRVDLMELR